MTRKSLLTAFVLSCLSSAPAFAHQDAKVFFVSPKDGATVESPLKLKFGIKGMKLRPAGEDVKDQESGHHHLLIDTGSVPEGQVIPSDETHLHFGKAQTEAEVKLSPGKHKLTLQLADGAHRSFGKKLSSTIEVTVK